MASGCTGPQIEHRHRPFLHSVPTAVFIAMLYFVLAFAIACTKAPWIDEGWHTYPAYNLSRTGLTGSSILDPMGTCLGAD
jgi:hypothetical protein